MLTARSAELLQEMIRIKSVTFAEGECARYIASFFSALGFASEVDEANNVIAEYKGAGAGAGGGKRIFFLGHHDTVEEGDHALWTYPPFSATLTDGKIYGRGAADEKGGLASLMAAIEKLFAEDKNFPGEILVVSSREETSDLSTRGIVKILERKVKADYCIVVEPTLLEIMLGHKGRAVLDIETRGKTAHSSVPEKGVNAINHMAHLLVELEKMDLPKRPPLGQGTQSVGVIKGGVRPNIVPEKCEIQIDRRVITGESVESIRAETQAAIDRVKARIPDFDAVFKIRPPYLPSVIEKDSPVVGIAAALLEEEGINPVIGYMDGHTDGEWIVNDLKIPTIILGPGDMKQAHSTDEHIEVEQLGQAARIYYNLLKKELY